MPDESEGRMEIPDDDFPYSSDDPSLAPLDDKNALLSLTSQQVNDIKGALRLAIGSTMLGTQAATRRLRKIQATQQTISPDTIVINENETTRDQLRYLLLGILFETPELLQRGLANVEQASSRVFGVISRLVSPLTNSWIFSPVKGQYNGAVARGERVVDRLVMKGRVEEQNSRLAIQQKAIDDLVNEVLEYVLLKTDIQQLIQESGIGVASSVMDEFQEQSSNVDLLLDSKLRSFFKRVPSQPATPPTDQADGSK